MAKGKWAKKDVPIEGSLFVRKTKAFLGVPPKGLPSWPELCPEPLIT